jgi:hypothetical protein
MSEKSENQTTQGSQALGKTVFYITAIAMLVFFWWLLIYDHGVVSTH